MCQTIQPALLSGPMPAIPIRALAGVPPGGSGGRQALAAVLATLALTSCSTVQDVRDQLNAAMETVQEPDEKTPHALMRISTDAFTVVHPGQACDSIRSPRGGLAVNDGWYYIGARGLKGQLRGVTGDAPKGLGSGELRVAAGEPLVLRYMVNWRSGDYEHACRAARSFVPVEGAHYQVFTPLSADRRSCGVLVMQLAPTPALVATADAPRCEKR